MGHAADYRRQLVAAGGGVCELPCDAALREVTARLTLAVDLGRTEGRGGAQRRQRVGAGVGTPPVAFTISTHSTIFMSAPSQPSGRTDQRRV